MRKTLDIQLRVSPEEKKAAQDMAYNRKFPSVASYIRALLEKDEKNYIKTNNYGK